MRSMKSSHLSLLMMAATLLMGYAISYASIPVDRLAQVGTLDINEPLYMALTPNGKTLYVVNAVTESDPDISGSISVVSTRSNEVVDTIELRTGFPMEMAISPNGKRVYLAVSQASGAIDSEGDNRVEVIDTKINAIVATIPIDGLAPYGPIGIAISSDGKKVYVSYRGDRSVRVIDTGTNEEIASVKVGDAPVGIAVTPNKKWVYVANRSALSDPPVSTVSVIDARTNAVVQTIPLSLDPAKSTTDVAITPDVKRVYVTYAGDSRVAVIDAESNEEVEVIDTPGSALKQIALIQGGNLAFVSSAGTDELLVIDTNTGSRAYNTVVGTVQVGSQPFDVVAQMQTSPNAVAYVSNRGDNTISLVGREKGKRGKLLALQPGALQNAPNPFNASTQISYQLPEAGEVSLVVYNLMGQQVRVLVQGYAAAGLHEVIWDGRNEDGQSVSSGIYLYRLESPDQVQTRRMLLLQ